MTKNTPTNNQDKVLIKVGTKLGTLRQIHIASNFRYEESLRELSDTAMVDWVITLNFVLTNKEYESVVLPLKNYITKAKIINNQFVNNTTFEIRNTYEKLEVKIHDITANITIPPTLRRITFGDHLLTSPYKVQVQNIKSILIDTDTYKRLTTMVFYDKIIGNEEFYKTLEKLAMKELKEFILYSEDCCKNKSQYDPGRLQSAWEYVKVRALIITLQKHAFLKGVMVNDGVEEMVTHIDNILAYHANYITWVNNQYRLKALELELKTLVKFINQS